MNYKDIMDGSYFKKCYSLIEEMKKDFPVNHGFVHINDVVENAKRLALTFNLDEKQKELLLIAATLHDIGYLQGRYEHARDGSVLAEKYLLDLGMDKEDVFVVCNAIKNHGGKKEEEFKDMISLCLIVADKLDFISRRYDRSKMKTENNNTFLKIEDAVLEYKNDQVILKIIVEEGFDTKMFEEEKYYNKLTELLTLLGKRLKANYTIAYSIINKR